MICVWVFVFWLFCTGVSISQTAKGLVEEFTQNANAADQTAVEIKILTSANHATEKDLVIFERTIYLYEDLKERMRRVTFRGVLPSGEPADHWISQIERKGKLERVVDGGNTTSTASMFESMLDPFEACISSYSDAPKARPGFLLAQFAAAEVIREEETAKEYVVELQLGKFARRSIVFSKSHGNMPVRSTWKCTWDKTKNRSYESSDDKDYIITIADTVCDWARHGSRWVPVLCENNHVVGPINASPRSTQRMSFRWLGEKVAKELGQEAANIQVVDKFKTSFESALSKTDGR
jgi:hypothetical protein